MIYLSSTSHFNKLCPTIPLQQDQHIYILNQFFSFFFLIESTILSLLYQIFDKFLIYQIKEISSFSLDHFLIVELFSFHDMDLVDHSEVSISYAEETLLSLTFPKCSMYIQMNDRGKNIKQTSQKQHHTLTNKEDGECDDAERTYTEVEGEEGIRVRMSMRAVRIICYSRRGVMSPYSRSMVRCPSMSCVCELSIIQNIA